MKYCDHCIYNTKRILAEPARVQWHCGMTGIIYEQYVVLRDPEVVYYLEVPSYCTLPAEVEEPAGRRVRVIHVGALQAQAEA